VEVNGHVEALDEQGVRFYNASNVVYRFTSESATISGQENAFKYVSMGTPDVITISTGTLNSGL
jgi:hypothetical protein